VGKRTKPVSRPLIRPPRAHRSLMSGNRVNTRRISAVSVPLPGPSSIRLMPQPFLLLLREDCPSMPALRYTLMCAEV
jgi:hypothetical protein